MVHMNETLQTIHQLRSIRNFTEKPIQLEELETILDASLRAACSSARQCYSVIALKDKGKIKAVCGYDGAAALIYCVDYNRLQDIAEYLGEKRATSYTSDFITGSTDAILAAQTAVIAAKSLGIDSLFTNSVHYQSFDTIYDQLKLPDRYCFPLIAVVLGYSASDTDHQQNRVKAGVIHYNTYHHLNETELEQEIALFDSPEKTYGVKSDWDRKGYTHYYNWFFQAWTRKWEDKFYPVLKETGFMQ
jgi:nitroreductase